MKSLRKMRIHAAVAAACLALGGGLTLSTAHATPTLSTTNTGQALVFPYYTVNNGWITTFNVTNTSDLTVAVKVRFHEKKNTRDVLDFNVVLSPYDVWTAYVQDTDFGPQLLTGDQSCTSPQVVSGAIASNIAYTGQFNDTGGSGFQRMRDGYVEMLVMGVADAGEEDNMDNVVAYNAKHVDGVPRDCAAVDKAFVAKSPTWVGPSLPTDARYNVQVDCDGDGTPETTPDAGNGSPEAWCDFRAPSNGENPLKGNIAWLQIGTGAGAGGEAISVADWSTLNLVTAQQFPWFLEPTFPSPGKGLWTVDGAYLDNFEGQIAALSTFNEWANNPSNGAAIDWAVVFPTKAFHVDKFNQQIQAAVSRYRNAGADVVSCTNDSAAARGTCTDLGAPTTVDPFEYLFGVQGNGDSIITVEYALFDREEGTTTIETDGTTISPAPPPDIVIETLRYEANVIQFADASVLGSTSPTIVDAGGLLGTTTGWAKLSFIGSQGEGLPVAAFAVKARTQGEASSNYGQAIENGYERPVPATVP